MASELFYSYLNSLVVFAPLTFPLEKIDIQFDLFIHSVCLYPADVHARFTKDFTLPPLFYEMQCTRDQDESSERNGKGDHEAANGLDNVMNDKKSQIMIRHVAYKTPNLYAMRCRAARSCPSVNAVNEMGNSAGRYCRSNHYSKIFSPLRTKLRN